MRLAKIVIFSLIFAIATAGVSLAGEQIKMNQITEVSASVENKTSRTVRAAVKLFAYDNAGTMIGHLCQEVYLSANDTTMVNYAWQAPAYETGIYWSSKVEKWTHCGSHDHDDTDSDSH